MIDRRELKASMARNDMTQIQTAQFLGLSLTAFRKKLDSKTPFNESEIKKLVDRFGTGLLILPLRCEKVTQES